MKTLILTCSRNDSFCGGYVAGLMASMGTPWFGGWCHLDHESDIARGRSKLLDRVLRVTDAEAFLWVDDDIEFTAEDFVKICTVPDVQVIGGMYPLRHVSRRPCLHWLNMTEEETERWQVGKSEVAEEVVPVRAIGTGFLWMTRAALETMRPAMPVIGPTQGEGSGWTQWFPAGLRKGIYMSEDFAFCDLAWDAGVSVYAHRGVRLTHVGLHGYELGETAATAAE